MIPHRIAGSCASWRWPGFYKAKHSELVAVMRRDLEKARQFATRHNVPHVYSTYQELIEDSGVDGVYVATPPGVDRIQLAKHIAKANKPCIMEKPLARDSEEAAEIVRIFRNAHVPLYVAYYRRCLPKFVAVKAAMPQLGLLTSVTVTLHWPRHLQDDKTHWHYNKETSGGGLLLDVGCHMLDLVDYLIGPIEDCHGVAAVTLPSKDLLPQVEDNVRGYWKHTIHESESGAKNIVLGSGSFNFCSGGIPTDQIEIQGSEGSVSFSCFDPDPARLVLYKGDKPKQQQLMPAEYPDHVHQPMIQAIVNELLSHNDAVSGSASSPCSACPGDVGLRTSIVMDQLLNGRSSWSEDYV